MNELKHIYIYNPAGANYILGNSYEFPLTDSCERSAKVMGEDYVRLVFKSIYKVVFDAFSFIRYNGQTFFLRERYIPTPDGTFKGDDGEISTAYFSYDVKFVSVANMLDKYVCYRHVVVSGDKGGEWNEPEININGNLETMYKIIIGSIQQVAERLSDHMEFTSMLKTIPANGLNSDGTINTNKVKLTAGTKLLTFNFSGDKIANVCTTVANNFTNDDKKDTEWYITEDNGSLTLHFAKYVDEEYGVQYVSDYISNNNGADSFAHPQKSGGLKKVDYAQEWSGITNVIVPYGSTRNMTYQAAKGIDEVTQMQSTFGKRLRLKPNTYYYVKDKDGKDVSFLTDQQGAVRNTSVDTGIEEVRFYDEIYPQGHFRVTEVETKNKRQDGEIVPEYTVSGVAIDSNGNEIQPSEGFYPIAIEEGTTLSVRFEKGLLNGREFEIANKTRKDEGRTTYSLKFTIVADGSLEDGTLIPSGNFIPREGDEFALFNMKMPEVYITAAEKELAQRVYSDLEEAVSKRPEVKCTSDPTTWDKEMALGSQFQVKSEKFNSEDTFVSRVISYSYKLTKPKDIQFNLASAIMQGTLSSMNDQIADVTHQAGGLEQRAINLSRRGWRDAAEMADMLDSLAADMMLVGNEKYQFAFTAGIEIVNSNNQTTAIKIGEGTLQHTQDPYISDYTSQGWWSHGAVTLNNGHTENGSAALTSVPDTPFYLYAVVGQNSTDISFELQDQEQDGEVYLLLGILSSVFTDTIDGITTNYRVFNRTNGYTQISGGTITTEQIQDAGRNLIIDFQSNPPRIIARNGAEIIGNIKFKASDEKTAEEQLAALGIDVGNAQSAADAAAQAAKDEAEKVREEYKAAIAESEDNMTEALAASVAEINGGIESLQKQVDGEVNSWFMEGEPANNYRPANEWTDQTLKYRHLGDTYTNILPADVDLSTLDSNGTLQWVEQGYLQVGSAAYGKTYAEQRQISSNFCMTKCIMQLANTATKITITPKDIPSEYTFKVLFVYYNAEKKYYGNDAWQYNSDNSSITFTVPAYGNAYGGSQAYYFSILFRAQDSNGNYLSITPSNIASIESEVVFANPEAGKSWRWCNYDDEDNTTFHWHPIADSDAVKALQEAGKAQSTADGKSTTFVVEPTNYNIGDLWILAEDRTLNGTTYKKGTILTANAPSATFDSSHWSEKVKYIDESIAAQQAQQALDGLEIGGRNLLPKSSLLNENELFNSANNATITNSDSGLIVSNLSSTIMGVSAKSTFLSKVPLSGKFVLSFDICTEDNSTTKIEVRLVNNAEDYRGISNYLDIDSNWKRVVINYEDVALCRYLYLLRNKGSNPSSFKIRYFQIEQGNKATDWTPAPEDVDSKADAIQAIADGAAASAKQSNDQLANMSNDKILTPQEKGSVADEWACIQEEYAQNSTNKTTAWGSTTVAEWTAYNTAYTTLQTYVGTLELADRAKNTNIDKTTFQTNFANYYSANVAFLNALAIKVAELEVAAIEIGGENLVLESKGDSNKNIRAYNASASAEFRYSCTPTKSDAYGDELRISLTCSTQGKYTPDSYSFATSIWIQCKKDTIRGKKYTISFDARLLESSSSTNCTVYFRAAGTGYSTAQMGKAIIDKTKKRYSITVDSNVESDTNVYSYFTLFIDRTTTIYISNVKVEQGNKATGWSPAPEDVDAAIAAVDSKAQALEYLKTALANETEVTGGIVATTSIQLRDKVGSSYVVNAGLSGVKDDNILLWGGGDYTNAVTAANNSDPDIGDGTYDKGDGSEITTLIKKDGTGKIGIFKISETQAIVDVPNLGEVVIDAVNGVSVKDKSKVVKALVTPKTMSEAENDIKSATFVNAEINVNDTYNISTNGLECSKVLWSNPSAPALSVINGTLKVTAKFKIDLSRQSADNHWIRMIVSLGGAYGFTGMTGDLDITSPFFYQGYFGGEDDREMTLTATCTFTNAEAEMLDEIRVHATMYAEDEYHEIIDPTYSFEPNVEISAKIELATDEKINNSQYSIMAKDGFLSMSGKKMFKVLNGNGGTQKIFAKGLSGAKGNIGSGELYISSDFILAFRELCDVLEDFFPLARTIGSNTTNAEQCVKKVQAVRNALKTTSIIASS